MSFSTKGLCFLFLQFVCFSIVSHATTVVLPPTGDVIGELQYIVSENFETVDEIGKHFDVGYHELIRANPHIHPRDILAAKVQLIIPSQYILPPVPRKGIVINLAEYRLYYFPENENVVLTFPVGIGRKGWETPLGVTNVVAKVANPRWKPTANLRAEANKNGNFLPEEFPPGPYNPLGRYALRLGWPTFLIHGTNRQDGIGARVSAGCIRMYPEDIETLFHLVAVGTQVRVINQPVKIGQQDGHLMLQAYPLLSEQGHLTLDRLLQKQLANLNIKSWNNKTVQNEFAFPSGLIRNIGST